MKRTALLLGLLTSILVGGGGDAVSDETQTLNGEYVWNQGASGDLEAVFTPTGEQTWNVDFHFEFRGKDHTYSGTAEGSLSDGKLRGTVKNEGKRRTFTFSGKSADGVFKGTHAETTGGRSGATGTLTLAN